MHKEKEAHNGNISASSGSKQKMKGRFLNKSKSKSKKKKGKSPVKKDNGKAQEEAPAEGMSMKKLWEENDSPLSKRFNSKSSDASNEKLGRKRSSNLFMNMGRKLRNSLSRRSLKRGGGSDDLKVVFLGAANSGKTTLFQQMVRMAASTPGSAPDATYQPTEDVVTEKVKFQKSSFELTDVGGAGSERVKWSHLFEGIDTAVFVVAIDEYDQTKGREEPNSLLDSMELFEAMYNNLKINNAQAVVILNKADLFRHKLCTQNISLNTSGLFPNAPNTQDFDEAVEWIRQSFRARVGEEGQKLKIFETTATDDEQVYKTLKELSTAITRRHNAMKWSALL